MFLRSDTMTVSSTSTGPVNIGVLTLAQASPDPVQHVPGRLLRDPQIPCEQGARCAPRARVEKEHSQEPILVAGLALRQWQSRPDREVRFACSAPVRHGLALRRLPGLGVAAMRAEPALRPPRRLEPGAGGFIIGVLSDKPSQGRHFFLQGLAAEARPRYCPDTLHCVCVLCVCCVLCCSRSSGRHVRSAS